MSTLLLLLSACSNPADSAAEAAPPPAQADPVSERTAEATARLEATQGGRALLQTIDAHGGLSGWYRAGSLTFDFDYLPEGAPERRMFTRNQVDLQSVRVRQTELGDDADAELGWDGSVSWITPSPEAFPTPAAFWATTPYYFVGMPFVLADPGTNHTLEGPVTLTDPAGQTIETQAIRVTFDSGIGQAPDDFYVVHADPETHQMVALRYIVTDPSVRRPDAPPPKQTILFYRAPVTTGGLTMTTHYDGFHWRDDAPADRKSTVDITHISFGPPLEDALFQSPHP